MTTPEQLLADPTWRRRNSTYTLWALLIGFGFVSLLYTGIRARKSTWTKWGVAYAILVIGAITLSGSVSPEDPTAPTPVAGNIATAIFGLTWVASAVHVFRLRKEWLRWKSAAAGQPRWYEATGPVDNQAPTANLSGLGIDDPTSDYLAPSRPTPGAGSAPPPPPVTAGQSRLPPPPTGPPPVHTAPAPPPSQSSKTSTGVPVPAPIDLNSATLDDIASLPGVGVAAAHRIVEERERRGGFESVDEAAVAAELQPHARSKLHHTAHVSARRRQPQQRGPAGRIVDI